MKTILYNLHKAFKSKRARAILLCLVSMFSLSAQTPRKDSGADGLTELMHDDRLPKLLIGDRLPAEFWSQKLDFHYTDGSSKSVLLDTLKDRLIVIDFWATYCSPCVKSLDKWDAWQKKFPGVQIIPIHLYDFSSKALPFAKKRNWSLPLVFDNAVDTAINKLFYYDRSYGQIWIRDGRLFAIPVSWEVAEQDIQNALQGIPPKMNLLLTHGEKRKERGTQP